MRLFACLCIVFLHASYLVRGETMSADIVEGSTIESHEFPYQVSFTYGTKFCGGSLISDRHVLTAAHCVKDVVKEKGIKKLKVSIGSDYLSQGKIFKARRISYNKDYEAKNTPQFANDIAVIQLAKKVEFSDKVQKINLPTSEPKSGTPVIISGFGSTVMDGRPSHRMKKYETTCLSYEDCTKKAGRGIPKGAVCAVSQPINKEKKLYDGACSGDSGGPMASKDQKTIIGVFSGFIWNSNTSKGCSSSLPNVFTRVYHYRDYIDSELNEFTKDPTKSGEHPSVVDESA